ncbi:MAG: hypothetical protein KA717_16140 [Woronichinia naegeliana WA131]|jgi:uncharacterized protein YutE (UPF0331/DUF86 family)|uniref:REase AHJR-like domain-containing protein n=1 Tax=Woronichinia naegeliana WA131 TaxID=2824559 RepID=A0A977L1R5_9CYAN|nr:MAG: hypothetical protein KA717_16140 [Woronichinia naegeliana WA131]
MATPTVNLEREKVLQLAAEYRKEGYEVFFRPSSDDLPDFLKGYRPDLVLKRGNESVIVEVRSRFSLNSPSTQYLRYLAQVVEEHSDWRFELVMTNSEDIIDSPNIEGSLQQSEIETRLQAARQLVSQYPESAILYSWSLVEATLRLVADHEGLNLQRFEPLYLMKQLVTEGLISRSQYQLLKNAYSLRSNIAHGFKITQLSQESVYELIDITEHLLETLNTSTMKD